jgi:type II secretion system protein N
MRVLSGTGRSPANPAIAHESKRAPARTTPGPACEFVEPMHSTMLGLVVLICGCSNGPPAVEKGAFKIDDVVQTSDDELRVRVDRREVPLHEMPVASVLAGLPMSGLADIAIDLTVPSAGGKHDYRKASGTIAFGCPTGCTIGDDVTKLVPSRHPDDAISFGHVTFDKVDVRVQIDQGHVKVTRWQLESKDLTLAVKLDIDLATELVDSLLDGCVRFKPSRALEQRDPKTAAIISATGAPRGPDGFFSIKVGGQVGQRRLLGQACS